MNREVIIENERIKTVISCTGAEMTSLMLDGAEYLWEGDPQYWKRHSPILFPFVGRLSEGCYLLGGKSYPLECHGFCQDAEFDVIDQGEDHVTFELTQNEETLAVYPYEFSLRLSYVLSDTTVKVSYIIQNRSDEEMHFGIGAHPAFKVPFDEGLEFEDYYLEFERECCPDQVIMSDNVLVTGVRQPYQLEEGRKLYLKHDLFDRDAVVLEHSGQSVALKSDKGKRSAKVYYPGMDWVGFWHKEKTKAPFVCVEPWVSLPGREGIAEEFSARGDLIHLPAGKTYQNDWSITLS